MPLVYAHLVGAGPCAGWFSTCCCRYACCRGCARVGGWHWHACMPEYGLSLCWVKPWKQTAGTHLGNAPLAVPHACCGNHSLTTRQPPCVRSCIAASVERLARAPTLYQGRACTVGGGGCMCVVWEDNPPCCMQGGVCSAVLPPRSCATIFADGSAARLLCCGHTHCRCTGPGRKARHVSCDGCCDARRTLLVACRAPLRAVPAWSQAACQPGSADI